MKLNKIVIIIALFAMVLSSCNKMDYHEYTAYDKEYIERSFSYVGGFMAKIYNDIDTDWGNLSGAMLASATDEAEYSHDGNSIEDFYNGSWSAANPHQTVWTSAYEGITYCNEFLANWSDLKFEDLSLRLDYEQEMFLYNNYKYEARWARAYFYFTLVRQYGAVPFKTMNSTGTEETLLPCTSVDSIFSFIETECDAIKDSIIADYTNIGEMALYKAQTGRASKYSVLALKAQAALYHASPLFNKNNAPELWHKAALASKELIEECEKGGKKLAKEIDALWSQDYITNADAYGEILFARRTPASNSFESYNFPVGYSTAQGGNCPTQDLVDAFDYADGTPFDWAEWQEKYKAGKSTSPYENRDPRLAKTVAVNGEAWPNDLEPYNPSYPVLETYVGGYHSRTGKSAGASYATTTSYYLKKYCNPSQILKARSDYAVTTSPHGWLTFRLGGAYLNYAEAVFQWFKSQGKANAADFKDSEFKVTARELANKTRTRAGVAIFPTGMTNDEFWGRYKKERQVELAFEGHRFYDVRRWKEDGDKFMKIHRLQITKNADGKFEYQPTEFTRGDGKWQDRWNLFPFSQTEIMKSKNAIVQNPGW
ncbi:MAG: RagB/SusD family nutrient uptake outer membrane protein [Prevotella sp.]|nr:RagB/SusD family nutrient uptake outer membrane protein [Candidatus Equicola faecalis]